MQKESTLSAKSFSQELCGDYTRGWPLLQSSRCITLMFTIETIFLQGLLIDLFYVLVFRSVLASDSVFEATKVARICINNVKERVPFGHICIGHFWAIMANFRSGVVSFLGSWNSWLGIGEYRNLYIFKIWSTHIIFVSTMDYLYFLLQHRNIFFKSKRGNWLFGVNSSSG